MNKNETIILYVSLPLHLRLYTILYALTELAAESTIVRAERKKRYKSEARSKKQRYGLQMQFSQLEY